MGEITDMILEGTLCQLCGVLMEDMGRDDGGLNEPPGYPRYCVICEKDAEDES